ncbi:MAG: glycosyltransferase [Candidatus Eremiobacteraeota bacterium]|nr:glycosyltransferase [Candidatus Eremiobacteraeota bacterium]
MVDCLVVGSHLRFDGVWQRPQQIVTRLARRVPVLFVEEPFPSAVSADRLTREGDVEVLRPLRPAHAYAPDEATIARVLQWVGARGAAVWLYTPMMLPLAGALPDAPLVYDCMDDLTAFENAPPAMGAREADVLDRARLVFCGGASLYDARRDLGSRVKLAPSGVEFDHFARAVEPHPLYAHLAKPVFGYTGVIDERIDFEAIDALAAESCNVAMIGPLAKIDPAKLPRRANVHFTGRRGYDELPAFLAGLDVAIMPFAANAATRSISPTKTPEYLAARKPVVSTPIADVVRAYGDVVTFASGARAFADACMSVATRPDDARLERGVARARDAGWDDIVRGMWNALERE